MLNRIGPLVTHATTTAQAVPDHPTTAAPVLIALILGIAAYLLGRARRMVSNPKSWPSLIAIMTVGPTILVLGAVLVIVLAMAGR
jgi:hypothetical protein